MSKSSVLCPVDIPVAIYLAIRPYGPYSALAKDLGISVSTAHAAVVRLTFAGLLALKSGAHRAVSVPALEEFLLHGVKYAFPVQRLRQKRGVPTAHAAPVLARELDGQIDPVVWASANGSTVGAEVKPLLPSAPALVERCPQVYEWLALVDAIRIGTARDREVAGRLLSQRLEAVHA